MSQKRRRDASISVGNIENSKGIVIGHESSVSVTHYESSSKQELISLLDEFIDSLGTYSTVLPAVHDVHDVTVAARAEIAKPSPKWRVISGLLAKAATGVAGIAVLTDAINNIQALVSRLAG